MRRPICIALLVFLLCNTNASSWAETQQSQQAPQTPPGTLVMPAGTSLPIAMTRPIWARSAAIGDTLYAITVSPVTLNDQTAIPSGTYVEATIQGLIKPTTKLPHATIAIQLDKLIFANGYTLTLSNAADTRMAANLATVTVAVTTDNDLLLDNGTQIAMALQTPLGLNAGQVAQALPPSHPPAPGQFVPATLCRFIPGSPGTDATPDTVIPGTPGTPPTVIPGADGSPDIVIPGTPGTPSTTIPGTPGTPPTAPVYCPAPPQVVSSVSGIVSPGPPPSPPTKH